MWENLYPEAIARSYEQLLKFSDVFRIRIFMPLGRQGLPPTPPAPTYPKPPRVEDAIRNINAKRKDRYVLTSDSMLSGALKGFFGEVLALVSKKAVLFDPNTEPEMVRDRLEAEPVNWAFTNQLRKATPPGWGEAQFRSTQKVAKHRALVVKNALGEKMATDLDTWYQEWKTPSASSVALSGSSVGVAGARACRRRFVLRVVVLKTRTQTHAGGAALARRAPGPAISATPRPRDPASWTTAPTSGRRSTRSTPTAPRSTPTPSTSACSSARALCRHHARRHRLDPLRAKRRLGRRARAALQRTARPPQPPPNSPSCRRQHAGPRHPRRPPPPHQRLTDALRLFWHRASAANRVTDFQQPSAPPPSAAATARSLPSASSATTTRSAPTPRTTAPKTGRPSRRTASNRSPPPTPSSPTRSLSPTRRPACPNGAPPPASASTSPTPAANCSR